MAYLMWSNFAVPQFIMGAAMSFPGQPSALRFNRNGVTECLRRGNIQGETYGLTDEQKCLRLPDYYNRDLKSIIEALPAYIVRKMGLPREGDERHVPPIRHLRPI